MEQEIIKHTKKIFGIIKRPGHSFMEKSTGIVTEVLIIVFAVTLSIWLHSISEHHREQKEVRAFFKNLLVDLDKDVSWMKAATRSYNEMNKLLDQIVNLTPSRIDSLKKNDNDVRFPFQELMNQVNCGNYEGFKSSGKIGQIENEELRKAILNYYQQDAPTIIDVNNLYNDYMLRTLDVRADNADKTNLEALLSPKMQLRFEILQMLSTNILSVYNKSVNHATELIKLIKEELKK